MNDHEDRTSSIENTSAFSSLSKAIIFKIIAMSSLITILSTGIQLYRDYSNNVSAVEKEMNSVSNLIVPELSYNLWHLDIKALNMQLHSLSSTGEFSYVELIYDGKALVSGNEEEFTRKKEKTWPLIYSYKGEQRKLGSLRVVTDLDPYINHVLDTAIFILIANFIKTFIVAFAMIYILRMHVMTHLNLLSSKLKNFKLDNLETEDIKLNRPKNENIDELDIVVDSVNRMRRNLYSDLVKMEEDRRENEDLTHRLNQSQKMEALGRLAGGIAHDFNNILHLMMGSAEQCVYYLESKKYDKLEKYLNNIVEFAERGDKLIRQILMYTHQKKVEHKEIELVGVIQGALDMMRSTLPANIKINFDFEKNVSICGDVTQMQQIIMNFCTNARDSIDKKNGIINISIKDNPQTNMVKIYIEDNGSGISKELQAKIYEPYFSTKPVNKGTGMGLSIIQSIIQQMNGTIELISEEGKGATFVLTLPIFKQDSSSQPALEDARSTSQNSLKDKRVLILDDEEYIANLHRDFIERHDAQVRMYTSPKKALEDLLAGLEIDVVLADLSMPEMSGLEFAKEYSANGGKAPIILLTGHEENILSESNLSDHNIEEVLLKPINLDELLDVLVTI
ncbi:ATP-binding protein [Halobacteriovorax sp. HLS]|uniref:ATP-binding protein n=1 Tax=Halobacteriovorax sp. HLS TaxID=2234000 RepID=UPI000FDA474C|nr:ATP-binding protein [Halobacteriovorax sp. HLS]